MTALGADKDYTCGDLAFDNKNHTVLAGKNPTFKSVDAFLLFMKNYILQDFPKRVAEKYYEEGKTKGEKLAYANSLDVYKIQLKNMELVDQTIMEKASKVGGISKFLSEMCNASKDNGDLEVSNVIYTLIVSAVKFNSTR